MEHINVAVIGFGLSAQVFHLPFLTEDNGYCISAFVSSQRDAIKAQYPGAQVYASSDALFAAEQADLVVITSPNNSHYSIAKQALQRGCHVVVEKPITVTSSEARELIELAQRQQRVLTVYHNRRLDGDFLTLQQLISQGKLGHVYHFASRFDRFRPQVRAKWKEQAGAGNGAVYDIGSHLIDQALLLFGMPHALSARCLALREQSQTVDFFQINLHYPKLDVQLSASPFNAGQNHRFSVQGDLGSVDMYGLDNQESQLAAGVSASDALLGIDTERQVYAYLPDRQSVSLQQGNYVYFYQQLKQAITHNQPPLVTPESALQVISIIEAAYKASETGQTVSL
ncbi:Gfo/Idh/MocA family oxidoreductase [Thalassotalea ponticola]|uniref:Gfo/Idh/MocA family oxidoreductase n=1 Tax=Thalassotalea ponticola TaxID=1523392 RepID=UPI0025B6139E|nr:Gfo/Idh/MocA family oxidoreductase [Thalassotalea ponticola]MDN3652452.1 Gfo/Idh/MocA family oxidoreductase [Thalassotalea ponticola]